MIPTCFKPSGAVGTTPGLLHGVTVHLIHMGCHVARVEGRVVAHRTLVLKWGVFESLVYRDPHLGARQEVACFTLVNFLTALLISVEVIVHCRLVGVWRGVTARVTSQRGVPTGPVVGVCGGRCVVGAGVLRELLLATEGLRTVITAVVGTRGRG